jgi:hypothetical protein
MVPVTDAPRLLSLYIKLMYVGSVAIGILKTSSWRRPKTDAKMASM